MWGVVVLDGRGPLAANAFELHRGDPLEVEVFRSR
jgi:hypothetical protein